MYPCRRKSLQLNTQLDENSTDQIVLNLRHEINVAVFEPTLSFSLILPRTLLASNVGNSGYFISLWSYLLLLSALSRNYFADLGAVVEA